jgi:hypothetical protein
VPESLRLETVFGFKDVRPVAVDNTLSLGGQGVQLLPGKERQSSALAQTPVVRARQGRRATSQGRALQVERTVDETARQPTCGGERKQTAASRTRPAANHPWRKPLLPRKQTQASVQSG